MYLGMVVIGFAIWALRPSKAIAIDASAKTSAHSPRLWMFAATACLLLSLGPFLFLGGEDWVRTDTGGRYRLPWWGLQQMAPGLAITHPLRLAVPALAVFSALAATGASQLLKGRQIWMGIGLVAVDGLMFSGAPWPVATAPAEAPPIYDEIRRTSDEINLGRPRSAHRCGTHDANQSLSLLAVLPPPSHSIWTGCQGIHQRLTPSPRVQTAGQAESTTCR